MVDEALHGEFLIYFSGSHPFGRNALLHQRNKVCGHHGLSCIQLNSTIFLSRRLKDSNCWDVETRAIFSGCECMWPKHHKGNTYLYVHFYHF